ncbi:MAG: DUF6069 family protein [Umezawaea sp.]
MTTTPNSTVRTLGALAAAAATATAAIGSVLANTVIALLAHAAGASPDFQPLQFGTYLSLTVVGVLAGAVGWQVVRRRAANPAALLRRLVPAVVVVSLVPDVVIGFDDTYPGVSWGAVAALMLMHVAVALVAVPVYRRFLPLS